MCFYLNKIYTFTRQFMPKGYGIKKKDRLC